ncbi:MAG: asparaginase [Hyphomicrobiaceae bacterium]|nr:asparaginase [Hyphomicrobiaceae bacterium]
MQDIALVEVTRGPAVESLHHGALVVMDGEGRTVLALGDVERVLFPRSCVKILQALPLVESGIADKLGLSPSELCLCCASHNGEERHRAGALSLLRKVGLGEDDLECGTQWPAREADVAALHRAGDKPGRIYNNCSGKHAGFVCMACESGWDPKGYSGIDHPLQQRLARVMSEVTGAPHDARNAAIDGCSIPTYAIALTALARGFARIASGSGLDATRSAAARRLMAACQSDPFMIAGTERFCTRAMEAYGDRIFVKTGAEGVFCAALPTLGLGVALKARDGTTRAAEAAMAGVIAALLGASTPQEAAVLDNFRNAPVTDRTGVRAGTIALAPDLARPLEALSRLS